MEHAPELPDIALRRRDAPLTEAEWRQVMREFLAGASDSVLAVKWGVSNSTVASQRFKRGVYREGRRRGAAGGVRAQQAVAAVAVAEAAAVRAAGEALPDAPLLRAAQTPPAGDWRTLLFLGGRGAGKTLAGAAWLAGRARDCGRLALVGPTYGDVREVMIEGPSGLRGLGAAFGPEGGRPVYALSRRRLEWPNGAAAARARGATARIGPTPWSGR